MINIFIVIGNYINNTDTVSPFNSIRIIIKSTNTTFFVYSHTESPEASQQQCEIHNDNYN
jgi:sRNA-binding regulator protein Hfq